MDYNAAVVPRDSNRDRSKDRQLGGESAREKERARTVQSEREKRTSEGAEGRKRVRRKKDRERREEGDQNFEIGTCTYKQ